MLGKWPNPDKLSGKLAPARGLWIRRVLVRAQEGQLKVRYHCGGSGLSFLRPLLLRLLQFLPCAWLGSLLCHRLNAGLRSGFTALQPCSRSFDSLPL